jgi:predicted transposase YbfD/YdcC
MRISRPSQRRIFPPLYKTVDKGHGRLETRSIQVSTALNDYIDFPFCGQVFRIHREFIYLKTKEVHTETVFGLTSLSVQKASPEWVLSYVRGQWSIENRSHYVRDMAFDEDRAQIRKGKGPQMMACLRNFAISLLRLAKVKNISKALRDLWAKPHLPLRLLGL